MKVIFILVFIPLGVLKYFYDNKLGSREDRNLFTNQEVIVITQKDPKTVLFHLNIYCCNVGYQCQMTRSSQQKNMFMLLDVSCRSYLSSDSRFRRKEQLSGCKITGKRCSKRHRHRHRLQCGDRVLLLWRDQRSIKKN